jgi:hypothetical protein
MRCQPPTSRRALGPLVHLVPWSSCRVTQQLDDRLDDPFPYALHLSITGGRALVLRLLRAIEHGIEHGFWHVHALIAIERSKLVDVSIRLAADDR